MTNFTDNRLIAKAYERMLLEGVVPSDVPGEKTISPSDFEYDVRRDAATAMGDCIEGAIREIGRLRDGDGTRTDMPMEYMANNRAYLCGVAYGEFNGAGYGSDYDSFKLIIPEGAVRGLMHGDFLTDAGISGMVMVQLVNRVRAKPGSDGKLVLERGSYDFAIVLRDKRNHADVSIAMTAVIRRPVTFDMYDGYGLKNDLVNARKRGLQYHTPNLPK